MREKESLGDQGCNGDSQHAHVESDYKQYIKYDVQQAAGNQIIKRTFGISHGAQNTGTHII